MSCLKRWLRKHSPSRELLENSRWLRPLGFAWARPGVWHLNQRSAALAVAIGLFAGLMPGPTQVLSAAVLSVALRANLPVAVFTTFYTNPITIVPLYWLAYQIGARVTGDLSGMPPLPDITLMSPGAFFSDVGQWVWAMGDTLLIGLLLMGWVLACLGYLTVIGAWRWSVLRRWRARRVAA